MALTTRSKRPITRGTTALRDDRLFVVACDDTYAPKQYFDSFRLTRIQIHVVPTTDGTSVAKHVLERLVQIPVEEDDERWLVLDTDHCIAGAHREGFLLALKDAARRGVNIAVSRPCFEVWLAMHFVDDLADLTKADTAKDVAELLKRVLGNYNKKELDTALFELDRVPKACDLARGLDERVEGGHAPEAVTTRVYQLWDAILSKALPSQLPQALAEYREQLLKRGAGD